VAARVALRIVFRVPGAVGAGGGVPAPVEGPVLRRLDPVDAGAMRVWCDLMRDDNAIHTSRAAAARAGFGRRCVNPGPANLAYVLDALTAGGRRLAAVEARLLGNVFEGDRLTVVAVPGGAALLTPGGTAALTVAAQYAEGGA
jgi:acyl dehydratase